MSAKNPAEESTPAQPVPVAADEPTPSMLADGEALRLRTLASYGIMDSARDARFEALVQEIARECHVPIATITFLDADRQWFKAAVGVDVTETPRDISVCTYTILDPGNALVMSDVTQDERFVANPLVTGDFGLMAYAGVPIVTVDGAVLGTVCAMDREPHEYLPGDLLVLQRVSQQVSELLETTRIANDLATAADSNKVLDPHRALPEPSEDSVSDGPDLSFTLTRPLIEAIGEDIDVVRVVEAFAESVLNRFGWWAATVYWIQADRLTAAPWWIAANAPTGLASLPQHRPEPIVLANLQIEYQNPSLLDLGMARWLSDRDMLNALGARNLVVMDVPGAATLAARIVFLTPSSRALSATVIRTLTTAAAVLPRVIVQQRARQELTYRATHDALTGLYNRQGVAHLYTATHVNAPFSRVVPYRS